MKNQPSGNEVYSFFLGLKSGTHIVFIQTPHVLMFGVSECDNTHVAMNTTMSAFAHLFLQRVSAMLVFQSAATSCCHENF